MIKVVSKSGNLANLLRTTSSAGATTILPIVPAAPEEQSSIYPLSHGKTTAYTASCSLPVKKMKVVTGPSANFSVRFNHTDIKVPDFNHYRKDSTKNPNAKSVDNQINTKLYTSVVVGVGLAGTAYAAKAVITKLLASMAPAANVLALAKIEVNKSDIPEGKNVTFKWRGKPLFVRHRTDEEIKVEESVNVSSLRDPEHDKERVKDPKWLIVVGVCTHLGCVPIANAGEWGGYYCPCHGSHYDASGRIRKGPAPLNLEVPPYEFVGDTIVVG